MASAVHYAWAYCLDVCSECAMVDVSNIVGWILLLTLVLGTLSITVSSENSRFGHNCAVYALATLLGLAHLSLFALAVWLILV